MKTRLEPSELVNVKTRLDPRLVKFTEGVRKRLRKELDCVIGITGSEGLGKSTLAIWLGFLIDPNFDLVDNVCYLPSSKAIQIKFNKLKKFQCLDIDEAVKGLHKHSWSDKLQQGLIQMFTTERYQTKCTLVIMPRFKDFTENFRNHRIRFWINVVDRDFDKGVATAVVYVKDTDKDCEFPWHQKENFKIKSKVFRRQNITKRTVNETLGFERKTINYLFDFKFPKLPKPLELAYKDLKIQSRKEKEDDVEELSISDRENKYQSSTIGSMKFIKQNHPELKVKDYEAITGLARPTIYRLFKKKS